MRYKITEVSEKDKEHHVWSHYFNSEQEALASVHRVATQAGGETRFDEHEKCWTRIYRNGDVNRFYIEEA